MALRSVALSDRSEKRLLPRADGAPFPHLSPDGRIPRVHVAEARRRSQRVGGPAGRRSAATGDVRPRGRRLGVLVARREIPRRRAAARPGHAHRDRPRGGRRADRRHARERAELARRLVAGRRARSSSPASETGIWNVYWISRRGGPEHRLTNYSSRNSYVRYPAWSPRGDQIVYEYAETTGNIWLMDLPR